MTTTSTAIAPSAHRLLLAAGAWSAVLFVVAAATATGTYGVGVLWFAAIPAALTAVVTGLLRQGSRVAQVFGIVACSVVAMGVLVSFVLPAFLILPACALLVVAAAVR